MTYDFKITDKCPGMKMRYNAWDVRVCRCSKPQGEHWLRVWSRFLDSVANRVPRNDQMFHISKAFWVVEKLGEYYKEDELVQLTKFERKKEIFKIDLEEYL